MKKGLFLFSLLFVLGAFTAEAQSCQGKKSASKASCCMKAASAASADASIEKRMSDNGAVSYVRKESDTDGNVKFVSVKYDAASNSFVNVAPKKVAAASASTTAGMTKKACAAGKAKACCKKGAGKACCASKAKAKTAVDVDQK